MSWRSFKSMSITNRLLLTFISATVLILVVITSLVYPPMLEMMHEAKKHHEYSHFLLTQICIKKLFSGIWISAFVVIITSYFLAKKSMQPVKDFTKELASIGGSSLDKRLQTAGQPIELQQLATTCNEMLSRIENSFLHIKKFSASMAHELRNPVHFLQTATEITLAKPQSIETYQTLLHTHLEEYQNLTKLIDNLLFLTRSEQGQIPLKLETVSAQHLLCSVVDFYQSAALEKNITIELEGDAQIHVDVLLFKRVIANLIDNSLTYTPIDGSLHISIEKNDSNQIQIIIEDSGIGIAKEELPLICHTFYRIDHSLQNQNAGLGLGLAIAKSILENHKATLLIESATNQGTKATLTLHNFC